MKYDAISIVTFIILEAVIVFCAFMAGRKQRDLTILQEFKEILEEEPILRTPDGMRAMRVIWDRLIKVIK